MTPDATRTEPTGGTRREPSDHELAEVLPEPIEPAPPKAWWQRVADAAIQVGGPIAALAVVWALSAGGIYFIIGVRLPSRSLRIVIAGVAIVVGGVLAVRIVGEGVVESWREMRRRQTKAR